MMEMKNLGERMIRDKNEVTLPIPVRKTLNLIPGDLVRFELNDDGIVCMHKIITRKINNNGGS